MSDILIRDVPDAIVAAIDAKAQRLGLSRAEYLRRALARELSAPVEPTTVDDLTGFGVLVADLADPDVIDSAWR